MANEHASEPTRAEWGLGAPATRLRTIGSPGAPGHGYATDDASERSEASRERSEPAKRLARERVGESEGRSPSE
jgi:hypothetical protein